MKLDDFKDKQEQLEGLCRRHRVRRLALFGSALGGNFRPESSDLDFLVEFADLSPAEYADAYFGLWEDLAALFGRDVDLVTVPSVTNPYLRAEIDRHHLDLYAA